MLFRVGGGETSINEQPPPPPPSPHLCNRKTFGLSEFIYVRKSPSKLSTSIGLNSNSHNKHKHKQQATLQQRLDACCLLALTLRITITHYTSQVRCYGSWLVFWSPKLRCTLSMCVSQWFFWENQNQCSFCLSAGLFVWFPDTECVLSFRSSHVFLFQKFVSTVFLSGVSRIFSNMGCAIGLLEVMRWFFFWKNGGFWNGQMRWIEQRNR